jgi:signal transduction histidine kinase
MIFLPKEMSMSTVQKALMSFRKHRGHSIACVRPVADLDVVRPASAGPACLKSAAVDRAIRGVGLTLYEILGITELMRVAYEKGEMESVQNRLEILMSQATDLASTLANILELSKLETRKAAATYEQFDVVALLQEVAQAAKQVIGKKPVAVMDVASPTPIVILSDPAKVRQIMMGLISNAANVTNRGRIALILNKDGERVRLTVADTGKGMSEDQIHAIFSPYDIGSDNSGLGLRIIKHLVNLLEGSISVASKVGEGTIVEVSFPLKPPGQEVGSCRRTDRDVPLACGG